MFILVLVLIFVFYIAPDDEKNIEQPYRPKPFLMIFTFFYCWYFFLSALQIKFGYKKYKNLNSFMTKRKLFNNLLVLVFTSVPFL
jgi:hypothetical protein